MEVRVARLAEIELDEAISYYERQKSGLGRKFYLEIEKTVERIKRFPKSCPAVGIYTRRCLVNRFPFAIFYAIKNEENILILAVAHTHRNPAHFINRIK